jgi:hypothetical protein
MQISDEQRADFLEFLREGMNPQQAAERLVEKYEDPRITATKLKFLARREPVFERQVQEARIEGKGTLVERLERCAVEMAMGGHWPALRFLLTTYGEQFAWSRSSKVEVGGTVEIQAVAGILSRYLPEEQFEELMQTVEQRMLEEQPSLPPAVGQ